MKIQLTESQMMKVISEISAKDEMNHLLDKILSSGIESLSDEERIRLRQLSGEKVEMPAKPEPTKEEEPDERNEIKFATLSFFDNFPSDYSFEIGGREFRTYLNDFEYGDVDTGYDEHENNFINITDGDITVKIIPFNNETRYFVVLTEYGFSKKFKYNTDLPKNDGDASLMVRFFIKQSLPKIMGDAIAYYNEHSNENEVN
jgi:hypothetical protein